MDKRTLTNMKGYLYNILSNRICKHHTEFENDKKIELRHFLEGT